MSNPLFNRQCRLTIVKPTGFFGDGTNAVVITGLRVVFQIEKNLEDTPNTAQVSVFNLAEETRNLIVKKPLRLTLEVGYRDGLRRIFVGDIKHAFNKRHPVDWETIFHLGDGSRAFTQARVSRSFAKGTDFKTVLRDTAASMGLSVPKSANEARELVGRLSSGLSMHGPSEKEMSNFLKARGLSWSIQDNQLQVLNDTGVRRDQAVVISEDTGMIGSPERSVPKEEGEAPTVTVKCLIDPRLTPGGRVAITSEVVSGQYRISKVSHAGDTEGNDWYSTIEAK